MIGSKEFMEYADKANIPMSYRVWAYALWREAQKQATQKTALNSDYAKCTAEVLNYIHYSIDSKAGRDIQDIIKKHFA